VQAKGGVGFGHEAAGGGATVEWYTPAWVFDALGLEYDIDPCAPTGGLPWIPAKQFYSLPQDGLSMPWDGRIWCNPPYGPATEKWLARMNRHRNGIALVFARTDTKWFHAHAAAADAILFVKGRIPFVDETGKPPQVWDKKSGKWKDSGPGAGSMMIGWGSDCVEALRRMDDRGFFVEMTRDSAAPNNERDMELPLGMGV
jgi:hypothetical protein